MEQFVLEDVSLHTVHSELSRCSNEANRTVILNKYTCLCDVFCVSEVCTYLSATGIGTEKGQDRICKSVCMFMAGL
ncbi:hypothetical protein QQG55_6475 [Brugia pahangi]|uniref:Ovule protein n=1 Tax=Brugia pahangi TaxID=6280 RepID=A0A0N4TKV4_BRUPA|nr:unnamed protein product [Brugia pahangi]